MVKLTGPDVQRLLACVQALHSGSPDALVPRILESGARLVPSAAVIYRETDPGTDHVVYVAHAGDAAALVAAFKAHYRQHPLLTSAQGAGDRVRCMSEVVTPRELHRLPLYEQFFRPLGVEEQLELPLERSGTRTHALGFNRERAVFTTRERQLLEAFRPHVVAAARTAQHVSALRLTVQGLERALEGQGCALLVVDAAGRISAGTDAAWRLLRSSFGARADAATVLPDVLRRWLRAELDALAPVDALPAPPRPFAGTFGGCALTVHLIPNAVSGSPVLVLEEERSLSAALLAERFALTPREAEVLRWIADGKTNAETAAILAMQVGTVKKHLERIFAKLGCDSRAAALALAREATRSLGTKGG